MNHSDESDRLIGVQSDIAKKTELHTHAKDDNGVMKMVRIDEGIKIGAMKEHSLIRGGQHVMFMGLKEPFETGKIIPLTLLFEKAGEVGVEIVIDQDRKEKKHSHSHTH
jgi:copper(I)-binding protein